MRRYRYYQGLTTTEILAVGIEGDRHSLCGAIKRFQRNKKQWNGLLTLKEQCARHIALIKNEQIRWFITAYLPPNLFQYVTKDIFDLRRQEFVSNYAEDFYMCNECSMDTYEKPAITCRCPKMKSAIKKLNKHLFKQVNNSTKFELIYKIPNDNEDHTGEEDDSVSFFLYLSPSKHYTEINIDNLNDEPFDKYKYIHGQVSIEEKFLFIDVMRFFGGFRTEQEQPQLILYRRCEFEL